MKKSLFSLLILIILINPSLFIVGQEKEIKEEVSITAKAVQTSVPLNQTVDFFITVRWKGGQDIYTIDDFDNPIMNGFEIIQTSSSNIVEDIGGVQYSKKIYLYTLKPLELGMGYIDGVFLKYTNNETDESNNVVTKRIGIKVTKPIEESDYYFIIYIALAIIVITVFAYFVFSIKKKRRLEMERLKGERKVVDIETEHLGIIRSYKPDAAGDLRNFLNEISQAFNKYLSQKYEFEITGLNRDEIMAKLQEKDVDNIMIEKVNNIIKKSDIYRFSGKTIDLSEYELIYSSIESVIENNRMYKGLKKENKEESEEK